MFDVTDIMVALIGLSTVVLVSLMAWVWENHIKPWLAERQLTEVAEIVVNAVEAIVGRYNGKEKWQMALDKITEWGFDVDDERVLDALEAAWKKLDLSQIMAGEKEAQNVKHPEV